MGKLALVLAVAAAACLIAAGSAVSVPVFAGQCGIKAKQTVWADYGWPSLLPILAKPGTLLSVTTRGRAGDYPAAARKRGAATYALRPEDEVQGRHSERADGPLDHRGARPKASTR